MMSARHHASASPHARLLAIVAAAPVEAVEFCDWYVAAPRGEPAVVGHIQVSDRGAACRVLEALLGLDARLDLDVGPSTSDTAGRWSVWIRGQGTGAAAAPGPGAEGPGAIGTVTRRSAPGVPATRE